MFAEIGDGLPLAESGSRTRGTAPCSTLVPEGGGGLRSKLTSDSDSAPQKTPGCKFSWQSEVVYLWLHQGHEPVKPLHVVPSLGGLRSKLSSDSDSAPQKTPGCKFSWQSKVVCLWLHQGHELAEPLHVLPWLQKGVGFR